MSYSFRSKVRYSELDEEGRLSLDSIIDYFQDCSTFHAETVGRGMEVLKREKKIWVLSSWQIVIERYPSLGEELVIETWPYDFQGFMGCRNFVLKTEAGERLAYANTCWSHLYLDSAMPARIQKEDIEGYLIEQKLDMEYAPRKIVLPSDYEEKEAFSVQKHQLDTNHHVNNGQYIRMAKDYLPEGFEIRQMRAEYKKQALLGDMIYPRVSKTQQGYVIALCTQQGKPYAIVEFI